MTGISFNLHVTYNVFGGTLNHTLLYSNAITITFPRHTHREHIVLIDIKCMLNWCCCVVSAGVTASLEK